jgi:hypothetical protein
MDVIISNKSGRKCITIISPASNQTVTTTSNGPDHETTALSTNDQDETTATAPRVTITAPHDIITTVVNNILSNHHSIPIANRVVVDNSVSNADNSNDNADNSVPSGNVPATATAESSKVKKAGASNVDFSVALSELMDKVRGHFFFIYFYFYIKYFIPIVHESSVAAMEQKYELEPLHFLKKLIFSSSTQVLFMETMFRYRRYINFFIHVTPFPPPLPHTTKV